MEEVNHERLLRAIRCLQLIQRTNAPKSSIFKAAARALAPLMVEQATMPMLPGRPRKQAQNFIPPAPPEAQRVPQLTCDERGHVDPHSQDCPQATMFVMGAPAVGSGG